MDFEKECARKSRLLDLFRDLEESERSEMNYLRKGNPSLRYERMFKGIAIVTGINPGTIRLERENGKKIKAFKVTNDIAALLKKGDHLMMISGMRQGMWRLIRLECMGSEVAVDGKPSIHLSVMNRFTDPTMAN